MKSFYTATLVFSAFIFQFLAPAARSADKPLQPFKIEEHIGRDWRHEMVIFPLHGEAAKTQPGKLCLLNGNGQPESFQTFEAEDGRRIAFFVDLPPGGSVSRNLVRQKRPQIANPDLKWDSGKKMLSVWNSRTGIRVPTGVGNYENGPVLAVRLGSGKWVGGSRLVDATEIKNFESRIVRRGAIFADIECRYDFPEDKFWTLRFRVMAGEPVILVEEQFDVNQEKARFAIDLHEGFQPDYLLFREAGINGRWQRKEQLERDSAEIQFTLEPWVHWWKGPRRGLWMALGVNQKPVTKPGADLQKQPDPGTALGDAPALPLDEEDKKEDRDDSFLLYVASRDGSGWIDPETGADGGYGRLVCGEKGPELRFNLNRGDRYWMIGSLPAEGAYPDDEKARLRATPPQQWHIKYTTARLNRVKDWVLDWDMDFKKFPRLYLTSEQLEDFRERAKESEYWKPRIENPATKKGFNLRQVHWKLVKKENPAEGWNYARSHGRSDEYITYYLVSGNEDYARGIAYAAGGTLQGILNRYLIQPGLFIAPTNDPPRTCRSAVSAANMMDLAMGTKYVSEQERRKWLSRAAFVAYQLADPDNYSKERRYSANPNMTSMMHSALCIYACLLRNHPKSEEWAEAAMEEYDHELEHWVGPKGAWLENPHYQFASIPGIVAGSLALRNAGIRNFFTGPQLRKTMTFNAKLVSPPDPRYHNQRLIPAIGDGPGGARSLVYGWFASIYREIDPAFSRTMQWVWQEMGYSLRGGFPALAFYEEVLADRSLPAEVPDWTSELFPYFGVVLRDTFPGEHENYLLMHQGRFHAHYGHDRGSVHIYAKGVPLATDFGPQYKPRVAQSFMHNRVSIAHSDSNARGRVSGFSGLPRQDYVEADATLTGGGKPDMPPGLTIEGWPSRAGGGRAEWKRQILFIKDDKPLGPNYFVFRDSIEALGKGPTQWTMWTLSEEIRSSSKSTDEAEDLLADPVAGGDEPKAILPEPEGEKIISDALKLRQGRRYTAVGQFGVDTEYYIASPTDTPRHTLRWGFKLKRGYAGVREGIEAWQDVLHLQLPGSGHYFVAMFPRQQDAPAPTFETLGDGKIINVSGEFGTDYVFLSDKETDVEAGAVRFGGRAGSVQDRKTGTLLGLGTGGSVSYGKNELISKTAASLRATQDRLIVRVETAEAPRNVRFRAPGEWVLQDGDAESRLVAEEDALQLTIAAGVERVVLVRASD